MTPEKVWVFYPHNGNAPVLWTEPCPFPHEDEAERVEYVRAAPAEESCPSCGACGLQDRPGNWTEGGITDDYERCVECGRWRDKPDRQPEGEVAEIFAKWRDHNHMQLHAGEMTAQEKRSVVAVLNAVERETADALERLSRRVAELEGERDSLIAAIANHVTVRGEYYARATAAEARLDEALEVLRAIGGMPDGDCFCFNSIRNPAKPEHEHTGECRAARDFIRRVKGGE